MVYWPFYIPTMIQPPPPHKLPVTLWWSLNNNWYGLFRYHCNNHCHFTYSSTTLNRFDCIWYIWYYLYFDQSCSSIIVWWFDIVARCLCHHFQMCFTRLTRYARPFLSTVLSHPYHQVWTQSFTLFFTF